MPTWENDVYNYLRHCQSCNKPEEGLKKKHNLFLSKTLQTQDWRPPIAQQPKGINDLECVETHKELGLISFNSKTYFITEDGWKYRLPNGEVKICITQKDAYDWVKRLHEYQLPHLIQKEILAQVHKGPYW